MPLKTALIAGATGLTGSELLKLLIESEEYHLVKVLTRSPIKLQHPKIQYLHLDFDNLSAYADAMSADDVFCCLGTTIKKAKTKEAFKKVDYFYPLELAGLTHAQGAQKFLVVSSVGANEKSFFFYAKVKGAMEKALSGIGFDSLHIFRPSLLLGKRKELRIGEYIASLLFKVMSHFFVGPLKKYRGIKAKCVAKAIYKVAQSSPTGTTIYYTKDIHLIAGS